MSNIQLIMRLTEERRKLLATLKLARFHIMDTPIEHAIVSLEQPEVGLGGYLDAVIAEVEK